MAELSYKERIAQKLEIDPFLTFSNALADVLRQDILSCRLLPGTRIREQEISMDADISRTTTRKAFEVLIYEGFLQRDEFQHLHVAGLDPVDDRNLRDFRIMIEPTAARYAAKRRTWKDLDLMDKYISIQMETHKPRIFIDADMAFHEAVVKATYNPYLITSAQGYINGIYRMKRYHAENVVGAFCRQIQLEHAAIYEAIFNGDALEAAQAAMRHVKVPYSKLYQEKYGGGKRPNKGEL